MKFSIAVLAATFALTLFASATPLEDKEAALKAAIKTELEAKKETSPREVANPSMNAAFIMANLDEFLTQVDNPAYGQNVDPQITQLLSGFSSDAAQKAAKDFLDELHKERKDKADAAATELKAELGHAKEVINAANKPEDLDDLLVELQKFQEGRYGGRFQEQNQALYQQASATFEFIRQWQNYLFHVANGQGDLARQDVQSLSQNNLVVGIIPRSKILALTTTTAPATDAKPALDADAQAAQKIADGIQTLDDMAPALAQLHALNGSNETVRQYVLGLSNMEDTYVNLQAGLPGNSNFAPQFNGAKVSLKAFALLTKLQYAHSFDTFTGPAPGPDETPLAYIDRVKADALGREDWALLQKALAAHGNLTRDPLTPNYTGQNNETAGIENLITAANQVAARQFASALVSYQAALKFANPNLPAKLIGEKLDAIKRDHPADYEQGMTQFTAMPMGRYYPGLPLPSATNAPPAAPTPVPVPLPPPPTKAPAATLRLPQ